MLNDPLPLNLTKVAALRIIREVARDSVRVVFLTHARKQMQKRKITNTQVWSACGVAALMRGRYGTSRVTGGVPYLGFMRGII